MLRLFAKRGVRLAPLPVVQQPLLRRIFLTGDVGDPEQNREASGNAESTQQWAPGDNDRLGNYVEKLDYRVSTLETELENFKGDFDKAIGDLSSRMEAGFGRIETIMAKNDEDMNQLFGKWVHSKPN